MKYACVAAADAATNCGVGTHARFDALLRTRMPSTLPKKNALLGKLLLSNCNSIAKDNYVIRMRRDAQSFAIG